MVSGTEPRYTTPDVSTRSTISIPVTNCLQAAVAQTNCTSIVDTGCYCGQPCVQCEFRSFNVGLTCSDASLDEYSRTRRCSAF